jgi:hypothetical protein
MTFLMILAALAVLAVLGTVWTIHDGGHAAPPRSHAQDPDFLPPSALLH